MVPEAEGSRRIENSPNGIEHIIANGVECEPLLYKDREVMLRETERMMHGLRDCP